MGGLLASAMTQGYTPIVVMLVVVGAFGVVSVVGARLLTGRLRRARPAKSMPYECGITPERLPKTERFPVKFYVVAMLFIIFDIEAIFLYPWAVEFRSLGLFGLVEMLVFIGLVFVAYLYIQKKGGLEWEGVEEEEGARTMTGGASPPAPPPAGPDAPLPTPVGAGRS